MAERISLRAILHFSTTTAEIPASHKYEEANEIEIQSASLNA